MLLDSTAPLAGDDESGPPIPPPGTGAARKRVFHATLIVAGFSAFTYAATVLKDFLSARVYGTGYAMDAFLAALIIPTFLVNTLSGAFGASVVPAYARALHESGIGGARRLLSNVTFGAVVVLALVSLALAAIGPALTPLIASGFDPAKASLTLNLLWLLIPIVLLGGIAKIWAGVLMVLDRFAAASVAPAAMPVFVAVVLLLPIKNLEIRYLALAIVVGMFLQTWIVGWSLRGQGVSLVPRWKGLDLPTLQVGRQYFNLLAAMFLTTGNPVVDQSIAASLHSGSLSALAFGSLISNGLSIYVSVALGNALLPHFSRLALNGDWEMLGRTIRNYALIMGSLSLPVVAALIYFAPSIIRICFQRGQFTPEDTLVVVSVHRYYTLEFPFYVVGNVIVRALLACNETAVIRNGAVLNLVSNLLLDLVLAKYMGVRGIALSTALVYCLSCSYLSWMLMRRLSSARAGEIIRAG